MNNNYIYLEFDVSNIVQYSIIYQYQSYNVSRETIWLIHFHMCYIITIE